VVSKQKLKYLNTLNRKALHTQKIALAVIINDFSNTFLTITRTW